MRALAAGGAAWSAEVARARAACDGALGARRSAVLYTSRELVQVISWGLSSSVAVARRRVRLASRFTAAKSRWRGGA